MIVPVPRRQFYGTRPTTGRWLMVDPTMRGRKPDDDCEHRAEGEKTPTRMLHVRAVMHQAGERDQQAGDQKWPLRHVPDDLHDRLRAECVADPGREMRAEYEHTERERKSD